MQSILFVLLSFFIVSTQAQTTAGTVNTGPPAGDSLPVVIAPAVITVDTQAGPLSVLIPQVTLKEAQKDWQGYAGNGSKGKSEISAGQYTQYAAINKNISADPFNITAQLLATTGGVRVTVWLSDNNNFQNAKASTDDRKLALQKYVRDFAVAEYRQAVMRELKSNQVKQKIMEEELAKLVKEEERAAKNTITRKDDIKRANDAISTRKSDIVSLTAKIEAQKVMVDNNAADPNASKGAKKTLRDLEEDKVSKQRQNDKDGKSIETWNNDIRANDSYIADAREKEAAKKESIERQKQTVQAVQMKLEGIK